MRKKTYFCDLPYSTCAGRGPEQSGALRSCAAWRGSGGAGWPPGCHGSPPGDQEQALTPRPHSSHLQPWSNEPPNRLAACGVLIGCDELVCVWRKVPPRGWAPRGRCPGHLRCAPRTGWAPRRASSCSQTTLACSPGIFPSNLGATESSSSMCVLCVCVY